MLGVTDLWTYVLGVIFIILLPGPNSLYVLSVGAQRGVRQGYRAACGVFMGDTVLMVLAAAGGATLLRASPVVFLAVKTAGACYLGWIGLQLLRGAWLGWQGRADDAPAVAAVDATSPLRKALLISLLNPKAILFFLSFFLQFVDPHYAHPALPFLVLGTIIQFFSFLYLSTLIFSGVRLAAAWRKRRRAASLASGATGLLFLGFGARLAAASLE